MSKLKGRLQKKTILVVLVMCLLILSITAYIKYSYSVSSQFKNAIYPGVSVEDIDMSGKTKEEAENILIEKYDKLLEKGNISIKVKSNEYNLPYKELNVHYNTNEVVNRAFNYGRELNFYSQYKLIKNPKNIKYNLSLAYKEEPIKALLEKIDKSLNKEILDASIRKNGESFQVQEEKIKEEIDVNKALGEIVEKINKRELSISLEPTVSVTKPKISAEELKKIDSVISSFSTKFIPSERSVNIEIAARAASEIVVMPGETYSFNGLVGDTTPDKGYKEAPVIINKKLEPGYGGGVCQVSTTLHNAILRAGIIPIERMHHSMPVAYVPKGTDATVFYNTVDYKFKNTLNYPLYIHSYINNNELVFNIYSNSSLKNRSYNIVSDVYKEIPKNTKYIKDSKLKKGEEVIENKGSDGYKVKVYMITYENGREDNKRLLYDDYYKSVEKIVKRGLG